MVSLREGTHLARPQFRVNSNLREFTPSKIHSYASKAYGAAEPSLVELISRASEGIYIPPPAISHNSLQRSERSTFSLLLSTIGYIILIGSFIALVIWIIIPVLTFAYYLVTCPIRC